MCLAVKVGNNQPKIWIPAKFETDTYRTEITGAELEDLMQKADQIHAHNAGFERVMWKYFMAARLGFTDIPVDKWYCTASQAAAVSLPRTLSLACSAMGMPIQKDKEGYSVMLKLCKPDKKGNFIEDPTMYEAIFRYCKTDVDAEHALGQAIPPLSQSERLVWLLDQKINDQGIQADIETIDDIITIVSHVERELLAECLLLTGGRVKSVRQVAETLRFLGDHGVVGMVDLTKGSVAKYLSDPAVTGMARRLLEIRQQLGKSSVSKYKAIKAMASVKDGKVRGTLLYHGATTGRWSARGMQPQNLPRGIFEEDEEAQLVLMDFNVLSPAEFSNKYGGKVMELASSCVRSCLTASEGQDLYCADFSNIEGRVIAWMSGEDWKVQAFRDFDAGTGEDLYKVAYGKAFNVNPKDVTKPQRQIGKTMELACGYQGGARAFVKMGVNVGLTVPDEELKIAVGRSGEKPKDKEGELELWAKPIVAAWRNSHPNVVAMWYGIERAATEAIKTGEVREFKGIKFGMKGRFLMCRLPSGRMISYCDPKIKEVMAPWGEKKAVVGYMGVDSISGKWESQTTYGGSMFQSCVQATARDIMVESMMRLDKAGCTLALTVHDEIIADNKKGDIEVFKKVMSEVPYWAEGLPVAVSGWTGFRYRK
jgi:DNA polymerase